MRRPFAPLISCLIGIAFFACGTAPVETTVDSPKAISESAFDADSAYAFVARQLEFGYRVPGSPAHQACGDYLLAQMKLYADTVYEQAFKATIWDRSQRSGRNIIGAFRPQAVKRLLLAAHWDSRPYADRDPNPDNWNKPILGANDGASGVGVLLEVARQLSIQNPNIGVDIIFFDLEDYGKPEHQGADVAESWCLGAQHWAQNFHTPNYKAYYGVLLDMVGAANPLFTREGTSQYYAPSVIDKVWTVARQLGYGAIFSEQITNAIIDDHLYVNRYAGIPMIDIIHYDPQTQTSFFPYWHTMQDDLSKIEPHTLMIVGRTMMALIQKEAE